MVFSAFPESFTETESLLLQLPNGQPNPLFTADSSNNNKTGTGSSKLERDRSTRIARSVTSHSNKRLKSSNPRLGASSRYHEFTDDILEDEVSLITADTSNILLNKEYQIIPREEDVNTSIVVCPASANTLHMSRDFIGIISNEPDIQSMMKSTTSLMGDSVLDAREKSNPSPPYAHASAVSVEGTRPGPMSTGLSPYSNPSGGNHHALDAFLSIHSNAGISIEEAVTTFRVGSSARRGHHAHNNSHSSNHPPGNLFASTSTNNASTNTATTSNAAGSALPTLSAYGLSVQKTATGTGNVATLFPRAATTSDKHRSSKRL